MKKFLLALAAALVLCLPAFADNSSEFQQSVTFTNAYNGVTYDVYTTNNAYIYCVYSNSDSTSAYVQCICDEAFSYYYESGGSYAVSAPLGSTGYYGDRIGSGSVSGISPAYAIFPYGTSNADIASAFSEFLESQNTPGVPSKFIVPCGNVLYFKVDREQDVTFTAVMPVLSSLLGTPTGAWNSGIQYGPAASLPTSGTTFPILSQDPINFAKTVSNQNLLGQTKNAISTKHCIAGQYYALYLPYHYGGWLALGSSHVYPDGSTSGGIVGANVTVSGSFSEIKVFPLTEKANGDLLTGSVTLDSGSDDGFSSYFDGEISETGTVTWLDQNGDISSPSVGGTSYVPEDVSTESIIDQIKNILSSIVSEIKNLFSFGYEAVNTLVGLMHDFVGVFKQLYEWLPTEVYSALVSAIIVAITIGVFKVFL